MEKGKSIEEREGETRTRRLLLVNVLSSPIFQNFLTCDDHSTANI